MKNSLLRTLGFHFVVPVTALIACSGAQDPRGSRDSDEASGTRTVAQADQRCGAHRQWTDGVLQVCSWQGVVTNDSRVGVASAACVGTGFVDCTFNMSNCAWGSPTTSPYGGPDYGPVCVDGTTACPASPGDAPATPTYSRRYTLTSGSMVCVGTADQQATQAATFCQGESGWSDIYSALANACRASNETWGEPNAVSCCVSAPETPPPDGGASAPGDDGGTAYVDADVDAGPGEDASDGLDAAELDAETVGVEALQPKIVRARARSR